jgi:transposase
MSQEENKLAEIKYLKEKGKTRLWNAPRQKHSHEKKLQVVAEALTPGVSVASVARKHGLNTNLVFSWIRMYENGCLLAPHPRELEKEMQKFVIAGLIPKPEPSAEKEPLPEGGVIEIESKLGFKVRLSGQVDRSLLHLVLSEIWKLPS